MKKILLFIGFIALFDNLQAQDVACEPDQTFADSAQVVFPLPLDPNTQEGGLAAFPACIGDPYELIFTFRLGDSARVGGFNVDLLRAEIETTGAVAGLPEGINYFCNPPDCIFPDTTLGCIVLRGTPAESNMPGVNELVITARVTIDGLGTITETIPGQIFPGEYNLTVNSAEECTSVSTDDFLAKNITLGNTPNPVIDRTTIEVSSEVNGDFQFNVFDLAGKTLHTQTVRLISGYNSFDYDASKLEAGMYIYALSNETGAVSKKLIVGQR
ncbi:MAG: T9SS type A sorting domain-containing protein [Bacteroidota bacterium]